MDKPYILVVDDNHINRLFFESSLKKLHCDVETANDGFVAVALCQKFQFDLILMDIRMNGMNGVDSAKQIHQNSINLKTPIVAISAETFQHSDHIDFIDSLLKPVKQAALSQCILNYCHRSSLFNHEKALSVSHQDEHIVLHLRKLFVAGLKQNKLSISKLYEQQQTIQLNHELHQLLGSATICAAEELVKKIIEFKGDLNQSDLNHQNSYQQLMVAMDDIINS
jgi:two-component system sensor histidine kinase BarA